MSNLMCIFSDLPYTGSDVIILLQKILILESNLESAFLLISLQIDGFLRSQITHTSHLLHVLLTLHEHSGYEMSLSQTHYQRISPYNPVSILIGKMAARRITPLCKRNVIYIRQVRVKHLELTMECMEKFFNNGSMTMKYPGGAI